MIPSRRTLAVLLPNLELDGEILLQSDGGVFRALIRSLARRRPAFVLRGSLDGICQYFGVDQEHTIAVRVKNDDLVVLFGTKRGKSVAVHAAVTPDQTGMIRELCVGTSLGAEALPEYAPKVIETTANRVTLERIQGQPLMPRGGSEEDLQTAILLALEPLKLLHARRNPLQTPDEEFLRSLHAFIEADKHRGELRPAFQVLDRWNRCELGSVTVHGDYWLENLLGFQNRVTGILDWDRARRNGCPGFDALHLGFMSYAMWANRYVSELLASIWTDEWPYPWLAHYTNVLRDTFMVSMSDIRSLATMLWLSYFYYHRDQEPSAEWYRQMIDPVARVLSSRP